MSMRPDDIQRLTKRLDRILREMMPPDADYKSILIIAERESDGIKLSLGTNADFTTAAAISEMASSEFSRQGAGADLAQVAEIVRQFLDQLYERINADVAAAAAEAATKH